MQASAASCYEAPEKGSAIYVRDTACRIAGAGIQRVFNDGGYQTQKAV